MKKLIAFLVIAFVFFACGGLAGVGAMSVGTLAKLGANPIDSNDAVAILYVEGAIVMGEATSNQSAYSETIVKYLREIQKNSSVKAVVLRIESPGGSVVASREIYDEIIATRNKGKPIVASFGEIAASGGYYIAAGADKIYTHAGTLTGSIGVISVLTNLEGLTDKLGVKMIVVKSGPHKDESYGFRDLSAEERAIWQKLIDESYEEFVGVVAAGRNMDVAKVKQLADGRIYTGKQAQEVGLADEIGNLDAAVDAAAKLGKITGTPRTIKYRREPSFLETFTSSFAPNLAIRDLGDIFALKQWGRVMYLYVAP